MNELDLAWGNDLTGDGSTFTDGGGSGGGFFSGAGDFLGGLFGGLGSLAPAAAQFYTGLQANQAAKTNAQIQAALALQKQKQQGQLFATGNSGIGSFLPWIIGGVIVVLGLVLLTRK